MRTPSVASGLAARRPRAAEPTHRRSVLSNGLRIVTQQMPAARSVSVGIFVGVGSRHEDDAHAGLSHLLEHLVFKGTVAHPEPGALSEAIERCGGSVNASTDRELTVYSSRVPADVAPTALAVVAELALRPLLRHRDLTAEKPVIVDEIRMYEDSPGDHVFSLFDQLLFGRHALGREIAGTPRSVRRANHETVVAHWRSWYRPEHLVLAVAGRIDHETVARIATGWFDEPYKKATDGGRPPRVPAGRDRLLVAPEPVTSSGVRVAYRQLSQGNLCIGLPAVSRSDPDRWALDLLGAVLGDGMSSRLFLELRERRSLAYDVSTFGAMYADTGTFGVHAGFDPDQADQVVGAVLEQLERVVQDPITEAELERARAYTRGRLQLRLEETGSVASWLGTGESLLPRILTVDEVIEHLDAVTVGDVLNVARRIIRRDRMRLAVLGPFRSTRRFERMLAT